MNPTGGLRNFGKVAVVDDDDIFRTCFKILLKSENFAREILPFRNGREALEALRLMDPKSEDYPELLFLDINMPAMDGWTFLEEIDALTGANTSDLPIFVLSSSIDPWDIKRSKKYKQVLGYIAKPLTRENLVYVSGHFTGG